MSNSFSLPKPWYQFLRVNATRIFFSLLVVLIVFVLSVNRRFFQAPVQHSHYGNTLISQQQCAHFYRDEIDTQQYRLHGGEFVRKLHRKSLKRKRLDCFIIGVQDPHSIEEIEDTLSCGRVEHFTDYKAAVSVIANVAAENKGSPPNIFLQVDCEGCEFQLFPELLKANVLPHVYAMEIQFHKFRPPGADGFTKFVFDYCSISSSLSQTHVMQYGYRFTWELWRRLAD
jgi:hypothetical protein